MRRHVIAALVAVPALAHADDRDAQAHAKADEATALFAHNDFAGAAAKFADAYELNHDPSYLFDVAQAYRHGGDCIRAAEFYGRFLTEVPHPPNEDKIRVWYASQLSCAKERAAAVPIERPAKPPPPPPPSASPPERASSDHRTLVLALAGTSVAAFAVGGWFAWDSSYLASQRDARLALCSTTTTCSSAIVDDYDDRGTRANRIAVVGIAAGGLALAASATLFLLSRPEHAKPIALVPVPGGAVATVGFAW